MAGLKHKLYISTLTNPFLNLAVENYLFTHLKETEKILLLYRNTPSVIIGRFQNPWIETDLQKLKEKNIQLVRRQSGGGTVYHDLGNLNFSFICPRWEYDKKQNLQLVVDVLKTLHIDASINDRNDLFTGKHKISGSAYKEKKDRAIHHGTLLINADLDNLKGALQPTFFGIESKGVESVRSPVINLRERVPHLTVEKVIQRFRDSLEPQGTETTMIGKGFIGEMEVKKYCDEIQEDPWLFEKTPKFVHTLISDKNVKVQIQVEKGVVSGLSIEAAETVSTGDVERLKESLLAFSYKPEIIVPAMEKHCGRLFPPEIYRQLMTGFRSIY